jgi:hypothetical protein
MSDIFKVMKAKKKRAVDPDAPPRPNLMTHEVKLRSAQETIDSQAQQLQVLQPSESNYLPEGLYCKITIFRV